VATTGQKEELYQDEGTAGKARGTKLGSPGAANIPEEKILQPDCEETPRWFLSWKANEWSHLVGQVRSNTKLLYIILAAILGGAVAVIINII